MEFASYFPEWNRLSAEEQMALASSVYERKIPAGTVIHDGGSDCTGLLLVRSGQLRAYIISDEGRQITIYRLFDRDMCLFSASCMMRSIQFEISIAAEKDTQAWVILLDVYRRLMESSAVLSNLTNQVMASRFTDVMWLMEQVLWKSFDKRLAAFLLEERSIENTDTLRITHEQAAAHLGTAREVVTRMLRYFQSEGLVSLARGTIQITDPVRLKALGE